MPHAEKLLRVLIRLGDGYVRQYGRQNPYKGNRMSNKLITILWGLPGSGKTTYAKGNHRDIINADSFRNKPDALKSLIREAAERSEYRDVVIDGLFTTNEIAEKLMSGIRSTSPHVRFAIVVWNDDRESCLFNDADRRSMSSSSTIKNLPFEEPSKYLVSKFGVAVTRMTVERKPEWKVFADKNDLGDDLCFRSSSWSLGGTWGDCWGNEGTCDAEPAPTSFREFDELMEKVCPQITFMQYKKAYSESVTTETDSDSDYYGGSTRSAYFRCDIKRLYESLTELGLTKEIT